MKRILFGVMMAALAAASGASAQTLKPGLWEITSQMKGSAEAEKSQAQFQKNMASMSPEQRKKMEDTMAKHGMKMMPGGPSGMSAQMCMTKEMVERDEVPVQHGDCKTTRQPRSGNTIKFAFECTSPPSSGEGQYTFVSPEAYTVQMTMNMKMNGKPEAMKMDGSGKWLSADCGSVKPLQMPAK